ncbi:hypothetical protein TNCV_31741 [Trichonephila clavipes]|nr:hypothetical protein TNCV_31741 [Trichonephila clavipes]
MREDHLRVLVGSKEQKCALSDISATTAIKEENRERVFIIITLKATRCLLKTDIVILNHGQWTRMTPDLAPHCPKFEDAKWRLELKPVGWRSWFFAGLVSPWLRVQHRPKLVDFHDAENGQGPCCMIMLRVKDVLSACLT